MRKKIITIPDRIPPKNVSISSRQITQLTNLVFNPHRFKIKRTIQFICIIPAEILDSNNKTLPLIITLSTCPYHRRNRSLLPLNPIGKYTNNSKNIRSSSEILRKIKQKPKNYHRTLIKHVYINISTWDIRYILKASKKTTIKSTVLIRHSFLLLSTKITR